MNRIEILQLELKNLENIKSNNIKRIELNARIDELNIRNNELKRIIDNIFTFDGRDISDCKWAMTKSMILNELKISNLEKDTNLIKSNKIKK